MVIYTKRGDKGETSMYDETGAQRQRVSKDSTRVEALGAVDELNSFLGICIASSEISEITKTLRGIQKDLLTIGSILAGSNLRFLALKTKQLEKLVDRLEGELSPLANFVIPGGTKLAAHLQYARSLARRAERRVVSLNKVERVKPQILTYLNRLSDALFMLARDENAKTGLKDDIWAGKRR